MDKKQENASTETVRILLDSCFQAKRLTEQLPVLPEGITKTHNRVLDCIRQLQDREAGCRISDIAGMLKTSLPGITRMVNELEKKGYVQKCPSPRDRRAVLLRLSEKGEAYIRRYIVDFHARWAAALQGVSEEEARMFHDILCRFQEAMPDSLEGEEQ